MEISDDSDDIQNEKNKHYQLKKKLSLHADTFERYK